ncbi:MAG: hypothetical protein ACHP8B_01985 [Terriglobales bacterium]
MKPHRSMAFLAASVVFFHYCVDLTPEGRDSFFQVLLQPLFVMLLFCFCSEHCAELFSRTVSSCMRIVDVASAASALLIYKARRFVRAVKQMDGIGNYPCICGSRKLMSNCCGRWASRN